MRSILSAKEIRISTRYLLESVRCKISTTRRLIIHGYVAEAPREYSVRVLSRLLLYSPSMEFFGNWPGK